MNAIQQFQAFDIETHQGNASQDLNDWRKQIALGNRELAVQIGKLEVEHKKAYASRKKAEATEPLKHEGTVQERNGKAAEVIEPLRAKECELEGRLRGYRVVYESNTEILNSISSYLKLLQ